VHREQEVEKLKQLSRAQVLERCNTQRLTKTSAIVEISMVVTALLDEIGHTYSIVITERARIAAIANAN
jgi:hypothetical protein